MSRFALIIGLALVLGAPAAMPTQAQDSGSSSAESTVPDELQGLVGDFILEQEDESLPKCPITLTDQQSVGGWQVVVPQPCPAPYPPAASLTSWNVDDSDGSLLLMDGQRHVVMRLLEDEDGLYDTDPNVTPRFYLLAPYDENGTGGENDGMDQTQATD